MVTTHNTPGIAMAQPRKPSGARPAPGMSTTQSQPAVSVRAEYFNAHPHRPSASHSHSTPLQPPNRSYIPPMVHRPSMPSPKSTLIPSTQQLGGGNQSNSSSLSSRPSPLLSGHSADSLKETTRHNIGHLPGARQASANLLWANAEVMSPKSPEITTPKEVYVPRNEVDINFDNLMVCLYVAIHR